MQVAVELKMYVLCECMFELLSFRHVPKNNPRLQLISTKRGGKGVKPWAN